MIQTFDGHGEWDRALLNAAHSHIAHKSRVHLLSKSRLEHTPGYALKMPRDTLCSTKTKPTSGQKNRARNTRDDARCGFDNTRFEEVPLHYTDGERMLRLALCTMLGLITTGPVFAQEASEPSEVAESTDSAVTSRDSNERKTSMEVGLRLRSMSIPKAILDVWFYDDSAPGWAYSEPRPRATALAYGMEFAIKNDGAMGVFYFDYIDSNMEAGYWDDQDDPPNHLDGDYLKPDSNFGFASVGADYYQDIPIIKSEKTNGAFGLNFVVGGGLGLAIRTGEIDHWLSTDTGYSGYERYLDGDPSDGPKSLPKFFPLLDVNTGLRFAFGDRASLRLEGGLHSMIYWGATAGVMF